MNAASGWRFLAGKSLVWNSMVVGSAVFGLFLGMDHPAHSDLAKFSTLLAQHERMPGEVIVKLSRAGKQGVQIQNINQVFGADRFQISAIKPFETDDSFFVVKLAKDADAAAFLESANNNPSIEYAEPNYVMKALVNAKTAEETIPNDPEFGRLWGLKNSGQKDSTGVAGVAGADIGATKAWTLATGNKDIVVAVIDTGVDYTHPDLKDNIYANPGESGNGRETNGIDDDGNGFVDDFHGWNFAGVSNNNPMDDNEHGTHCSGTIAGKGNDGAGVAGINWTSSILPVKFLNSQGSGSLADAVKSIQYATKMGAKVMSNSWGGGGFNQTMLDAIKEANDKGLLFIAAAGNDSQNADNTPHYPAGYQVANVIAVAASTNRDELATFSTYGKRTVHIAAPGFNIYSTIPGGRYDTFSGTSMATPHVSGAAALVWGANPSLSAAEVKDRLLRSRDYVGGMSRKVAYSGRLNVYNALAGIYPPSPEPLESDWKDLAIPAPIESAHPYVNNFKQEWTIEGPENAKYMRIVFSKVDLEAGYDFVKIYDAKGAEMDAVSGKGEGVSSYYVQGNKVVLKFSSDSSDVRWGFAVDKAQVVY